MMSVFQGSPTVSVIIPCYNHGHYLSFAIDSILAQTLGGWEAIIVDDGSFDNTREVMAQFADSRIRYVYQENQGEAAARNRALQAATSTYVAFLDADDLYLPNALEDMSGYLERRTDIGVVFSDGYIGDTNAVPLMSLSECRPGIYEGNILEPLVLSPGVITAPVCTMVRASALSTTGALFDRNLMIG